MIAVTGEQESGWRGSKELWLEAAYQLLVEGGIDNVRILSLAKMLKLSRTSFYWFFKDREALLDALLLLWQEKNTSSLLRQAQAPAASLADATLNLFDCWLDNKLFDSILEHAIRSWGVQSPAVAQALKEADTLRMEAIKLMFIRHGSEPLVADVRSRALYLTQIGYISMNTQEDTATRLLRVPSYVAIFSGALPSQQELENFQQRHPASQQ
ncbi:TetR/AcrR family transcriptional regulator [Bacillus subtilis]|uniref:TetR/AcrR family transcriptional regulator n=1 Tax=Pseudochrobactrum asaccharolyticum TaxID=354351 RepID=UPI001F35E3B3|nr:TetR/AcrR family transcriptional regulator [Pseudochrobactrum asaccharolyticum]MCF7646815.1 TetR/AcrR family transcriptional regulator [Pseudochrobactrum asaccharolyticum]MCF7672640.1 TetR/AcrR family transcriptional regulator [Bacillus subtilis]